MVQPLITRAVAEADFVSIDYELTGLHEKTERYIGVPQAYEAHCQAVQRFIPVQLGICAGKYDTSSGSWSLTPASIYLYPSSGSSVDESSPCFSVSTAALNFLVSNGFDCNEWVSQGLGWLRPGEEADRRKTIQTRIDEVNTLINTKASPVENEGSSNPLSLPEGPDKDSLLAVKAQVDEWLGRTAEQQPALEIPMESAFLRLLAHTFISNEFPTLFSLSVRRGDARLLCVYRDQKDLYREQLKSLEKEMEKLDREIGARGVFDTISKEKIPLIGHNCFFDLLHTYQTFYDSVPPHVDQFKQKWLQRFPRTFDTKYLAESNEVLGGLQPPATLKGLCDFMAKSSKVDVKISPISPEFDYALPSTESSDLSHDAGYDAMMTSLVFLQQLQHILERKSLSFSQLDLRSLNLKPGTQKITIHDLLRSGVNRVRLVKTQPPSMNLRERE